VKPLNAVNHAAHIVGFYGQAKLHHRGFQVRTASDGMQALSLVREFAPDVIVLDVMMPRIDGLTLLPMLRRVTQAPIIMLSAKAEVEDKVEGLAGGADDYLSKPFNPRELVARIRAILRRASHRLGKANVPDEFVVGPITLNTGTHLVHVADKPVPLTGAEFRVLELLMRSAGQVISREAMTEQALGRKLVAYDRSIDTHISNLRRKLDLEVGKNPEIKNVRGSGYTLTWAHA